MDISILKDSGALLKGHFKLSAGGHSDTYIQCAKLMQTHKGWDWVSSSFMDLGLDIPLTFREGFTSDGMSREETSPETSAPPTPIPFR